MCRVQPWRRGGLLLGPLLLRRIAPGPTLAEQVRLLVLGVALPNEVLTSAYEGWAEEGSGKPSAT